MKTKGSGVKGEGAEGRGEEAWIIHGGFTAGLRQGGSQKYPRLAAWRNNSATEKARHDSSHFCCQSLSAQEVKCLGIITSYCDVAVYSKTPLCSEKGERGRLSVYKSIFYPWENENSFFNSAATGAFNLMSLKNTRQLLQNYDFSSFCVSNVPFNVESTKCLNYMMQFHTFTTEIG